jgi:hypothetical protein
MFARVGDIRYSFESIAQFVGAESRLHSLRTVLRSMLTASSGVAGQQVEARGAFQQT